MRATLGHWVGLTLGTRDPSDDAQKRYVSVARGASTALAARGVSVLTGLFIVPLAIRYLGAERYGAWVTIASTMTWFCIADLGLANGLTNALSEALAQGRRRLAQQHVASAFWLLTGIASVCGCCFALVWRAVDWAQVLNVHSAVARAEVGPAVALAAALFLAAFPLGVVDRVFAASQEGATGNLWSGAASMAALLALSWATRSAGGMIVLVLALMGSRVAVQAVSAAWLFVSGHRELAPVPSAIERGSVRRLMGSGRVFFIVQIAALILSSTDNVIIARVLGAEQVTPYSVTWTLFTLPSIAITVAFPYLWPAYTDALAKNDVRWIARTLRASLVLGGGVAVAVALPLAILGKPIIARWAGTVAVPPSSVIVWMALWSVISASMNMLACLLNAAGQVSGQAVYGSAAAALNVALSIAWARRFGIAGVIAATVVAYLLCAMVPSCIETARLLKRLGGSAGKA